MFTLERTPIYRHNWVDENHVKKIVPVMESMYQKSIARYAGGREHIAKNLIDTAAHQYANRARINAPLHLSPLDEDANIFGHLSRGWKKLFEDAAQGGIVGMGSVTNPDSSNMWAGGRYNPGYKSGSGDLPTYIFGLQNHLALNCIGFDLLPTIAVDTVKIVLTFVDTIYGGGTFDDLTNRPDYFEIKNSMFTYKWLIDNDLLRASTVIIIRDVVSGNAMKVKFMLQNMAGTFLSVELLATGTSTVAGTAITYNWNNSVKITDIVKALNTNLLASNPGKVYVVSATNTGEDTTKGTALTTEFKVGYASAIRTNISEAASNNDSIGGMERSQQEKGPIHNLNVIQLDQQIEIKGIEIEANTSNIQIKDMAATGINVIAYLYTGVQNQLIQTIDEAILNHLYALGCQHTIQAWEAQGINHSLYIGVPGGAGSIDLSTDNRLKRIVMKDMLGNDIKARLGVIANEIPASSYENQMSHGERLVRRIQLVSEYGAYQNRIAPYDFVVLSGELASAVKTQARFQICPVPTTLSQSPELHYAGTIFDTINVYKNPKIAFNDPRILMGRRGDDKDPGAKFLAYDLAASRQTIDPTTMAEKIRVWSRFEIADVGYYPELNYYVFVAINEFKWM